MNLKIGTSAGKIMNNTLHIFGCSHSTFYVPHVNQLNKNTKIKFWGNIIAENFNLKLYERLGQPGKNVEYILFDIFDRIINNQIQKNDLVILNTSYPLRFGTPRLQKFSKHPIDTMFNINSALNIKFDDIESFDELKTEITFILWYVQTFGAWKLLNSVCNNVYQWCLDNTDLMDNYYSNCKSIFYGDNLEKVSEYNKCLGITNYNISLNTFYNTWENLINHPINYNSWDEWIKSHPINEIDLHLHPTHYNEFAKLFIEQINY
jgi:hypothetical protein